MKFHGFLVLAVFVAACYADQPVAVSHLRAASDLKASPSYGLGYYSDYHYYPYYNTYPYNSGYHAYPGGSYYGSRNYGYPYYRSYPSYYYYYR